MSYNMEIVSGMSANRWTLSESLVTNGIIMLRHSTKRSSQMLVIRNLSVIELILQDTKNESY